MENVPGRPYRKSGTPAVRAGAWQLLHDVEILSRLKFQRDCKPEGFAMVSPAGHMVGQITLGGAGRHEPALAERATAEQVTGKLAQWFTKPFGKRDCKALLRLGQDLRRQP